MLDIFQGRECCPGRPYCNFVYINPKRKVMKRALSLFLFAACVALLPVYSYADDEEGDVIDIQYLPSGQSLHRSIVPIPLQATLYYIQGVVTVQFSYNLGEVDIRMTNCTAGLSNTITIDSLVGSVSLPVPFGSGLYLIEILTPEGNTYYGYFPVQ